MNDSVEESENAVVPPPLAIAARSASVRRILIVKFGAIGDVLMVLPAAAMLYASGCTIDWVASEVVTPILRLYPWINVFPVDEPQLLRGSRLQRLKKAWALTRALRVRVREHGAYDLAATLYYDRRYSLLTALIPARCRIALSRTDRRFSLLAGRHHADEYARILCSRPDRDTPFQVAPVSVPELPLSPRPPHPEGLPRIVLVPGGARNVLRDDALRRWPLEHYRKLAQDLITAGCEVVLAGGPDDRWASASFTGVALDAGSLCFADLIGSLSLVETLALFDSAAITVTHDTGPLHMAGITSTAVVSIFGPTDPHGRLPRRNDAVAIWGGEGFGCRPCYDGRGYAPCPENECMAQVTPAMVTAQVLSLIESRRHGLARAPRVIVPDPTPFVQIAGLSQVRA